MEDKMVWVIAAIVISVVVIAVSVSIGKTSKDTGKDVVETWGDTAKQHLTFGES